MKQFHKKKSLFHLNMEEIKLIQLINEQTIRNNLDNISRTTAYFHFYHSHPEVQWSFLASMVSRNAGWNMCDLEGNWFPKIIKKQVRKKLFLTYERANWLIFQDAYPQLLLYQYSTKINQPMFHLLRFFHVSTYMEREWMNFWRERNNNRLMTSQIINEQNIIQAPVIKNPVYRKRVFRTLLFFLQDWFHFSSVIFPTCEGILYGASVNGFKSLSKRIDLGKRLANILFDNKLYPAFYHFALNTIHTGSRFDYENYFKDKPSRSTPYLRCTYPVVKHKRSYYEDWSKHRRLRRKWLNETIQHKHPIELTKWYVKKQRQLKKAIYISEFIKF